MWYMVVVAAAAAAVVVVILKDSCHFHVRFMDKDKDKARFNVREGTSATSVYWRMSDVSIRSCEQITFQCL